MAIYKPRMGERPLWDFPDGTLCNRETAAYLTSKALGWGFGAADLPAQRHARHRLGAALHRPQSRRALFHLRPRSLHRRQLERMAIFDAIINNADRKGGHCLLDDDDHLWGIDHGLTFNASEKLRTVIWDYAGMPIPRDILADLRALCGRLGDARTPIRERWRRCSRAPRCACCSGGSSGWSSWGFFRVRVRGRIAPGRRCEAG